MTKDQGPWRIMTPEEYEALVLVGKHIVERDYDGFGGVAVWLMSSVAPLNDRPLPSVGCELTADFTRSLPGGKMDNSEYEAIESALDKADAPMMDGKRWLTLAERVAALSAAPPTSEVPSAWRPIESAPKDGTQVLTWGTLHGEGEDAGETPAQNISWYGECGWVSPAWGSHVPVLWQPLPATPGAGSGGTGGGKDE